MTTLNIEQYVADQIDAVVQMHDIEDLAAHLADKETFEFHGTKCVVDDRLVFGALGVSPELPYGIAFVPGVDCVIMNTVTRNLPDHHFNAIMWHELGHRHLEHDIIDQDLEHEADTYAVAHGYDMKATLEHMREVMVLPLTQVYPHQLTTADIDKGIAAL